MRKSKGEKIELLYMNSKKERKLHKKEKIKKQNKNNDNKRINLDNEIIIGVTTPKKTNKKIKPKKRKQINSKLQKPKKIKKEKKPITKIDKIKRKIIKWLIIIIFFILAIILFVLSSFFNIKKIVVTNNSKISADEIISLSELTNNDNIFSVSTKKIKNKIQKNAYIADLKIKRNFNGTITLEVKERIPTYMLKFANAYVYINNQGYMIEKSENPLELPTITGFSTPTENIKTGNRLITEDLQKLEVIIKIIENAKSKEINTLIASIDISKSSNYILNLPNELKTVNFGDDSNINEKILWLKSIIDKEKGIAGEIFLQNMDKIYFREKV